MEDKQIIELYWQRNEAAITETDNKYGKYCFSIAYNVLNDNLDSEECVNDTYLRAWNSIPPQRPDVFKLFLAKITRNLSFNRYNAKTAEKRGGTEADLILDELSNCIPSKENVEREVESNELGRIIREFARALPERECNIFVRRYFFSESIRDIAARYGLSESNVSVILNRIRIKLKKQLAKEGFADE